MRRRREINSVIKEVSLFFYWQKREERGEVGSGRMTRRGKRKKKG